MGYSRYDAHDWGRYERTTAKRTERDYTARTIRREFDPTRFRLRECVASKANPEPTPIILGLDETGSMGYLAEAMRRGLGPCFEQVLSRTLAGRLVPDPSLLACAIGDMDYDRAPIQITQFENDPVTLGRQIENLYLEGNGGGNAHESYLGPLYFAALRTRCDAFTGACPRKGFIFTMGDEEPQMVLTRAQVKRFFGDRIERDLTASDLIALVRPNWHYFHLIVEEGSYYRSNPHQTAWKWHDLLGQNAIALSDHSRMAEVIVSAIEHLAGRDPADIVGSWSGATSQAVQHALRGRIPRGRGGNPGREARAR
ncbi:MAG: hypothetical protein FWD68_13990 [Alphaproteobacteria bacterium]|nr:hypothetical protein [Alphaproteobacteria bacterium]